jgi:hypothetical protein
VWYDSQVPCLDARLHVEPQVVLHFLADAHDNPFFYTYANRYPVSRTCMVDKLPLLYSVNSLEHQRTRSPLRVRQGQVSTLTLACFSGTPASRQGYQLRGAFDRGIPKAQVRFLLLFK